MKCARTSCSNTEVTHYNHSTQKEYCASCAKAINRMNAADAKRLYGHPLCTRIIPLCPNEYKRLVQELMTTHTETGKQLKLLMSDQEKILRDWSEEIAAEKCAQELDAEYHSYLGAMP